MPWMPSISQPSHHFTKACLRLQVGLRATTHSSSLIALIRLGSPTRENTKRARLTTASSCQGAVLLTNWLSLMMPMQVTMAQLLAYKFLRNSQHEKGPREQQPKTQLTTSLRLKRLWIRLRLGQVQLSDTKQALKNAVATVDKSHQMARRMAVPRDRSRNVAEVVPQPNLR